MSCVQVLDRLFLAKLEVADSDSELNTEFFSPHNPSSSN
jgi:hypothetical protein